jgi:transposase
MADSRQTKRSLLRENGTLNPRPQDVKSEMFRDNDFFDADDLLQVKYEMLRLVEIDRHSVTEAAKTFGFSRPSFYQAQAAFQDSGLAGLLPHKRGPRSGHKLTPDLMRFVAELRTADAHVSSSQLASRIGERFGISVHPRSIDRQLRRQKKLR